MSSQLSRTRVRAFIDDGFVRIDGAFSYQKGERLQFAEAIEDLARRTGRFPQLVDSRSGMNRECFATISPALGQDQI